MRRLIAGCRRSWRLAVAPLSPHRAEEPEAACGAATAGRLYFLEEERTLLDPSGFHPMQ